ncbi:hypothetical protein KBT16_21760 [Nostoc sp. CCCryo 231-06]|nr:hypothetical protein [Nostoc sp. CCCryo 231-06]
MWDLNTLLTLPNSTPKYTIFVCKSCHRLSEERPENPPFDGDILLNQIMLKEALAIAVRLLIINIIN